MWRKKLQACNQTGVCDGDGSGESTGVIVDIAKQFEPVPEFDITDIDSYLRYQYSFYSEYGMSYDEFWEKDYRLVESYVYRHGRELDYHAQLLFKMYAYVSEIMQLKTWGEADIKTRGSRPKITEVFEPVSERGRYLKNLEIKKNLAIKKHFDRTREDKTNN